MEVHTQTADITALPTIMEEKKDYSLLRPFDLEAAKRGEAIIDTDGDECNYIAGPHKETAEIVVEFPYDLGFMTCMDKDLRMAPLAWVEGKPVYKGDVLYCMVGKPDAVTVKGFNAREGDLHTTPSEGCCLFTANNLTWTQSKVKREGFVCIVKTGNLTLQGAYTDVVVRNYSIFPTHEAAQAWAEECGDVTAIAPVSWEEPAGQEGGAV